MDCFRCCTSFATVPRQPPALGLLVLLDRALIPALAGTVMAHGWSGIAHVRLFSFQGTKKSNDTLLPWSVVSLLFVIYFVVILFVDLWRTRCALVCLSTLILYHNRTFVSIAKYKILCLFLIIFFRNHNMLCFYLCAIVAMLFPLYTPSKKPFAKDSNYWSSEPFWTIL